MVIYLQVLLFMLIWCISSNSSLLNDAQVYLDGVLQPSSCERKEYFVVDAGFGSGFASQFQLAASKWMRAFASQGFSSIILVQGRIHGYTDSKECRHVKNDWTCLFLPVSSCQNELLRSGTRTKLSDATVSELIPEKFREYGMQFWWAVVQYRLFRLQPEIKALVNEKSAKIDQGGWFPAYMTSVAGVHVRHGDKHVDGFKEYSLQEELMLLKSSPDCAVMSSDNYCFSRLKLRSVEPILNGSQQLIAIDAAKFSNLKSKADNMAMGTELTILQALESGEQDQLTPLKVFVTSDDMSVLQEARKKGFMVNSGQISQKTAAAGMFNALKMHPEYGFVASVEIISDIHFLSQCSTLLGIAASQVFRMAVAMSNVTQRLRYTVALDYDRLPTIREMSNMHSLPLPEVFSKPLSRR